MSLASEGMWFVKLEAFLMLRVAGRVLQDNWSTEYGEEKPKSGLVKFKGEDRQLSLYKESEIVGDLGTRCFQSGHKDSAISL